MGTPKKASQKHHKPTATTRAKVERLLCVGVSHESIAYSLNISRPTFVKHYANEIRKGKNGMHDKAMGVLARAMQGKDKTAVTAATFWLKTQAGFSETNKQEISGPGGAPIDSNIMIKVDFVPPKIDEENGPDAEEND